MASPTTTDAAPLAARDRQDRLLKTGLIGAGALTVTWWVLLACGVWRVIELAGV